MTKRYRGFTLVELLVVLGLMATLVSLLIPALTRVRSAAQATACLANLKQLGQGWNMYTAEHKGHLLPYTWHTPTTPEVAWFGYWPGVLENYKVQQGVLLCPSANEPVDVPIRKGYGSASQAWTGRFAASGSGIRLSPTIYRDGSYGYNRHLAAGNGPGPAGTATKVTSVRDTSDTPLFMDSIYPDLKPENGNPAAPVEPPPDLGGNVKPGSPEHWKVLISRHGRAINMCMVDGSARRVKLEELYMLAWRTGWERYRLDLPVD